MIGGTWEELALAYLGLEALAEKLAVTRRAKPAGFDELREQIVAVLSRPRPSVVSEVPTMEESADVVPLLYTYKDAVAVSTLSQSTLERAARDGSLTVVRVGRAVRIRPDDLAQYVDSLGAERRAKGTLVGANGASSEPK